MPANPPLIQAGDVATFAPKLSLSNAADAAQIALLVGEVSDMARNFCDRDWWIQSYNEQYYGKNNRVLMLKNRPITAVTSITVADAGGNTVLSPAPTDTNGNPIPSRISSAGGYASYWFGPQAIYLGGGGAFPDSTFPNIYVQYSAGYASLTGGLGSTPDYASIPADVKLALIKEVVFRYEESKRVGLKASSEGGQQTASYSTAPVDPETKMLLASWKRTWRAGF